jgi:hypothetical protein
MIVMHTQLKACAVFTSILFRLEQLLVTNTERDREGSGSIGLKDANLTFKRTKFNTKTPNLTVADV